MRIPPSKKLQRRRKRGAPSKMENLFSGVMVLYMVCQVGVMIPHHDRHIMTHLFDQHSPTANHNSDEVASQDGRTSSGPQPRQLKKRQQLEPFAGTPKRSADWSIKNKQLPTTSTVVRRGSAQARKGPLLREGKPTTTHATATVGEHAHKQQHKQAATVNHNNIDPTQPTQFFIHIGKAGGTSLNQLLSTKVFKVKQAAVGATGHFDWGQIDVWKHKQEPENADHFQVVTMLREPVARAISHFYFWRRLPHSEGSHIRDQSLSEYLFSSTHDDFLFSRDIWLDGQSGVRWLTGTTVANWIKPRKTVQATVENEKRAEDAWAMMTLAAERLEQTKWFALLDRLDDSLELLQYEYQLETRPVMRHENGNHHDEESFPPEVMDALASLMPQDLWLYSYAQILFDARWQAYQEAKRQHGGSAEAKDGALIPLHQDATFPSNMDFSSLRPPFPEELPCQVIQDHLSCTSGPLKDIFPKEDTGSSLRVNPHEPNQGSNVKTTRALQVHKNKATVPKVDPNESDQPYQFFLHIGKAGGTSLHKVLTHEVFQVKELPAGAGGHFDWSLIEDWKSRYPRAETQVLTMLREPVSRSISHFYFWRRLPHSEGSHIREQSMAEYLFNSTHEEMLYTRDIWADGQSAVRWLTGTTVANWIAPRKDADKILKVEAMARDANAMMTLAAERLEETKWFGLLERINDSMELLQYEYQLEKRPEMPHNNQNSHGETTFPAQVTDALASLMPQDIWLYSYAEILFEARWKAYQKAKKHTHGGVDDGALVPLRGAFPSEMDFSSLRPSFPAVLPCQIQHAQLSCSSGPLKDIFPVGAASPKESTRTTIVPPPSKPVPKTDLPTQFFLHIGKAGGTSVHDMLINDVFKEKGAHQGASGHFDWGQIDKWKSKHPGDDFEVVTMLREPIDRSISHFYFWRKLSHSKGSHIREQNLTEYLFNSTQEELLYTRDIWADGQSAVRWLTGTSIANWIKPRKTPEDIVNMEEKARDTTAMMTLAAERLEQTKWFGLLERIEDSMELLQYEYQVSKRPQMGHKNQNKNDKQRSFPVEVTDALASLMPQDIWLYSYAKILFEARWQSYQKVKRQSKAGVKEGALVPAHGLFPSDMDFPGLRPPFPTEFPCQIVADRLACSSGPLKDILPQLEF